MVKSGSSISSAVSKLSATFSTNTPLMITVRIDPAAGVSAYVVEDQPPVGWTVSAVSVAGIFDANNRKVKWGPFFDDTARTLTYQAAPPASASGIATFAGLVSFDGSSILIAGQRTTTSGVATSVSIQSAEISDDGALQFQVSGPVGGSYTVEYVTDLTSRTWTVLKSFTSTNPTTLVRDRNQPRSELRFYRVKLEQ